jgi:ATP-GRASP peptide maturase of grasp-with-spasm system
MILILSESFDQSTNYVIDWINHYGGTAIRINEDSKNEIEYILHNDGKHFYRINNSQIGEVRSDQIDSVWFRRGKIIPHGFDIIQVNDKFNFKITDFIFREYETATYGLYRILESSKCLGTCNYYTNKILQLIAANNVGLSIPDTLITRNYTTLTEFMCNNNSVITKGIRETVNLFQENIFNITSLTRRISNSDYINKQRFGLSLFQEEIRKEYEIRSFYISDTFYSMAIFSQGNAITEIDFRNYDRERPNRMVPYKLPTTIENKLDLLMKNIGQNTGSIDMVYTTDGEYVFLEVNPVGQYDMVSVPCNYFLDRKIAEYLLTK